MGCLSIYPLCIERLFVYHALAVSATNCVNTLSTWLRSCVCVCVCVCVCMWLYFVWMKQHQQYTALLLPRPKKKTVARNSSQKRDCPNRLSDFLSFQTINRPEFFVRCAREGQFFRNRFFVCCFLLSPGLLEGGGGGGKLRGGGRGIKQVYSLPSQSVALSRPFFSQLLFVFFLHTSAAWQIELTEQG